MHMTWFLLFLCTIAFMFTFVPAQEEIQQALDQLCSILPKSVQGECQVFVDTYTDQIIHLLINELTPDQVCVELHLCKPKSRCFL